MLTYLFSRHRTVALLLSTLLIIFGLDVSLAYAVSTTDVIEAFKYTYGATELAYLASEEIVMWNVLKRRQAPLGGRGQFIIPFRTKNAGVFQGHTEGGAKTTRRAQPDTVEATFGLQEFHGIVDISWKMLQDMRNSEYAFEKGLDFVQNAQRTRVFRLLNAEVLGQGRGELGILSAADDQAQITVRALPMVDLGMLVDLMDASDDNAIVGPDGTAVTAIDVANRAITTGTAGSGTAAGDYFTTADTVSTSGSLHMAGLGAWIATANPAAVVGNLGGINRSTAGNEFWQATVLTNSGNGNRPFTEDLGLTLLDTIRERGGKRPNALFSNLKILRRYHGDLREDVYFASSGNPSPLGDRVGLGRGDMQEGKDGTGKTPYHFSGIDWHAEPYMDANRVWGLHTDHLWIGHGENELPAPLSEVFNGLVEFFTSTSNTTFEIVSYYQGEVICDNPMALGAVTELSEN